MNWETRVRLLVDLPLIGKGKVFVIRDSDPFVYWMDGETEQRMRPGLGSYIRLIHNERDVMELLSREPEPDENQDY